MNGNALAHHNELIGWFADKRLQQTPGGQHIVQKSQDASLSADKYQAIGRWCSQVNRLFIDPPKKEPPQLFRRCKYSDGMFPPNKSTIQTQVAPAGDTPADLWTTPGKKTLVKGAKLTGKAGPKPQPGSKKERRAVVRAAVDDDEKNTALACKMADTSDHYVKERRVVHLNIHPEWKRKLSTGWTINRPLLYPKVPPPPPPDNLLVDIPDYLARNEENVMEVCGGGGGGGGGGAHNDAVQRKPCSDRAADDAVTHSRRSSMQLMGHSKSKKNSEDEPTSRRYSQEDTFSHSDPNNKATQCDPAERERKGSKVGGGVVVVVEDNKVATMNTESPRSRFGNKPFISDRSTSNGILNMLTVDDCKMMMRYRPGRVIDTQDTMILPPPPPPKTSAINVHETKGSGGDDVILEEDEEDEEEEEDERTPSPTASDSAATSSDQSPPIRLSQGSARTTLSPSQVRTRADAYRRMYDTCRKRTPEAKIQRPSSAAVEKAFDVLLDRKFQAVQCSRRPLSSPSKLLQSRPPSRGGGAGSSDAQSAVGSGSGSGSGPSLKFQHLNKCLRQQMYDYLDSRWVHTKMKFQRSKSGYTRSAMKKGKMITSSPRLSWVSDDEDDDCIKQG